MWARSSFQGRSWTSRAPLDDDELELVRAHPVVGAELVRASGFPVAAWFVLEHHERVDGAGYPAGLAGPEITLEARILHVVDAFTAMTSERAYRRAMSERDALAEVRRLRGAQFDAQVVDALESVCAAAGSEPAWSVDTITRRATSST